MQKKTVQSEEKESVMIESPIQPQEPTPEVVETPKKIEAKVAPAVDLIAETKRILDASPHVDFMIPPSEGDSKGAFETVQINGYKLTIQKGVRVSLPEAVVTLLAEKYRINMMVGRDAIITRSSDVQDALN